MLHRLLPVCLFFHTTTTCKTDLSTGKTNLNYRHQEHKSVCITKYYGETLFLLSKKHGCVPLTHQHPPITSMAPHHTELKMPPLPQTHHLPPQCMFLSTPLIATLLLWHQPPSFLPPSHPAPSHLPHCCAPRPQLSSHATGLSHPF